MQCNILRSKKSQPGSIPTGTTNEKNKPQALLDSRL